MHFLSVSFTHKNTDISIREKLAVNSDEKKTQFLKLLKSNNNIKEAMVLSTCNRVEVLSYVDDLTSSTQHIIRCVAVYSGIFEDELFERADIYEDSGSLHHLFSVASSLDSLVVGETQIVGQLKDAYKFALSSGACSKHLSQCIEYACKCAARVRSETQISKNPVSVSSVAVAKAKEIFGSLEGKTALIIGAGEMSELAARHLIANKAKVILINRSTQRVENLVDCLGDMADWDSIVKLGEYVNSYELIFSSTSASSAIITDDIIQHKEFKRYFFDIAVPRDIDITQNESIEVYSVDDLQEIVRSNLALREEQAQIAYSIVAQSTNDFVNHIKSSTVTPIIKAIREQAREHTQIEIQKAIKKGYLKNSDKDEAYRLIHQVFKAFLHPMTMKLKEIPKQNDPDSLADAMKFIFDIKQERE